MSGIAGVFCRDRRPVDRASLDAMLAAIAYRGPDRQGIWSSGPAGLSHCGLFTTPESLHEESPRTVDHLTVTADARLDNREEIIRELGLDTRAPEGLSDGELILSCYKRWGEACAAKLLGDFVFAIWDAREQKFFCARDQLGVKPFYYHLSERLFAFASEIKALWALPAVPRRLNEERVGDYLARIFEDRSITFYRDVERLPPARQLVVRAETSSVRSFWSLDPTREIRLGSDSEYADCFLQIFTEAVRRRIRSALPVGSMLSGGLDSSSIVCVAGELLREQGRSPLRTYSGIFPRFSEEDRRIDERRYMNSVLEREAFEPTFVEVDRFSPLLPFLWNDDEPFPGFNAYLEYAILTTARKQGTRVLLSGTDGDSTVSYGFEYLTELASRGKWVALLREAHLLSTVLRIRRRRVLWRFGFRPLVPESVLNAWRTLGRRNRHRWWPEDTLINPDFVRRIGLTERARTLLRTESSFRSARDQHARSVTSSLLSYMLEVLDKTFAPFGVVPRFPFFDRQLVEFCVGLPPEQKLHRGWPRSVLRRAMRRILPEEVQTRKNKSYLAHSFQLRLIEAHRELLEEVILGEPAILQPYLNIKDLQAAYRRYLEDPAGRQPESVTIFMATVLALWLKNSGFA